MYQPELGRFMQPDPKEFGAGDYNLYRYCHNDPVNKSDPNGLIISPLTSWGGGEWIRGILNITNWERVLSRITMTNFAPDAIRRSENGFYVNTYTGKNGATIYEAHTNWVLQLEKNQKPLPGVIFVDETVRRSEGTGFTGEKTFKSGFWTQSNGSTTDPWSLPFNTPNGTVKTTQTLTIEGRSATWNAVTNANGEVVSAETWAPLR
jgi:uncharacterized protein RhaS with RHS repeats